MYSTRIKLESLPNTRDLGGIVNKNGLVIKKHKLIRSGRLFEATEEDLKILYKDYDVRNIVDFREFEEIDSKPDRLYKDMKYLHLKAMVESNGLAQDERAKQRRHQYIEDTKKAFGKAPKLAISHMKSFYMDMVNDYTVKQYGRFIKLLIKEKHATLWHCSLGKDRAGIGAALILKLLDVDDKTIIEDYLYSTKCLYRDSVPMGTVDAYFEYAFKDYIVALYSEVISYYGSLNKLYEVMGINDEDIQKLQNKYLEKAVCVKSEIAPLRKVMLYRPSFELSLLNNDNKDEFLFDEIPNLIKAQKEHDVFSNALRKNGVEVYYIDKLIVETLNQNKTVKTKLINKLTRNSEVRSVLNKIDDNNELVRTIINGVKINDKYVIKPMFNLYFQRDPQMIVSNTLILNTMSTDIRKYENIFTEFIFKYHNDFKNTPIISCKHHIEGGDILNISETVLMIGISSRSELEAIEELYEKLKNTQIETIISIEIPKERSSMHLDTIITQVDIDKFVIYKEDFKKSNIYIIDNNGTNKINKSLNFVLKKYLNLKKITFIDCDDSYEQWNDGANTLAIKPGLVIGYKVNKKTNQLLKENGVKVIEISAPELGKGRGGTHCMSSPLLRY